MSNTDSLVLSLKNAENLGSARLTDAALFCFFREYSVCLLKMLVYIPVIYPQFLKTSVGMKSEPHYNRTYNHISNPRPTKFHCFMLTGGQGCTKKAMPAIYTTVDPLWNYLTTGTALM